MNATSRPQRRRKSALAGEHPAFPTAVPEQPTQPQHEPTEKADTAEVVNVPTEGSRVDAGTRVREDEHPAAGRSTADEARARKVARDAAWGWAAAMRKVDKRGDEWAREMSRAREAGALPGVLRGYITEAADRVGCPVSEVPAEVWQAAGLDPE